jgi:translation initiation factor IF-2
MRVYEIAKELGLSSKEVLSLLEKRGISLPSHMSILPDEAIDLVKKTTHQPTVKEDDLQKKSATSAPQKNIKSVSPIPASAKQDIKKESEKVITRQSPLVAPTKKYEQNPQESKQAYPPSARFQGKSSEEEDDQAVADVLHKASSGELNFHIDGQVADTFLSEDILKGQDRINQLLQRKGFADKKGAARPFRRGRGRKRNRVRSAAEEIHAPVSEIVIEKSMPLFEVAALLGKTVGDIILALLKRGMPCSRNHMLSEEVIQSVAENFGIKCSRKNATPELSTAQDIKRADQASLKATTRWPIAVVMGHVDHGKTTFLDYVRKMNIAASEKGGITQHLGAYEVDSTHGKIIFLDTPGHEAFTSIRQRGSRITDIAILMVAADDGVKPQTIEAIKHAQEAQVPIIVAINKIDKVSSQSAIETIKRQLAQHNLMSEDWGGQTVFVPISAKTGQGIDELLEMIVLQSQLMELKADAQAPAKAYILESRVEKGYGPVATVICTEGTLKQGDYFVCGNSTGKVRLLINSHGARIKQAGPSIPVQIVGFDNFAAIGEWLTQVPMDVYLKTKASRPTTTYSEQEAQPVATLQTLNNVKQVKKEIRVIIKTDTRGSKDALMQSIEKIVKAHKEINCSIKVILGGIGDISESDIELAENTGALVLGLHVKAEKNAQVCAKDRFVDLKLYQIIYALVDDLEKLLISKKEVIKTWAKCGEALVKKVFNIKGVGVIAGCYMRDGILPRTAKVVCTRGGKVVGEGMITSLQRDKKSVKEVHAGFECAFMTDVFHDWSEDDVVIAYSEVKEKQQ